MNIEEWQAKKLYINKEQLENALGISLSELPTKLFANNEKLADYLVPYASMDYFDITDCVALLVGENPKEFKRNKYDFYGIKEAISQAIQKGQLGDSEIIQDFCNDFNEFYHYKIDHKAIEKWAKYYGYKWELPPYKPYIDIEKTADNSELLQQLTAKDEEIAQLKAEIESLQQAQAKISELEKQLEQTQSVQLSPLAEDKGDNYNPKERETHLKLIYALTMARTNKDFSASVYFNSKGILKPYTMMNELISDFEESGIQGFSADSLRKKLSEILKMEELQAE